MKIMICDICKSKGQLTETRQYMSVKGRKDLRLDYCKACQKDIPKNMTEYIKFVYKLSGVDLSDEQARDLARR